MNKKFVPLSIQFSLVALTALLIGIITAFSISFTGANIVRAKLSSPEYVEKSIEKKVDEFQVFVDKNNISSNDIDKISKWVLKEKNVMLALHDNGRVMFDSTQAWRKNHRIVDEPIPHSYKPLYSISFADKHAHIELFVLFEMKYMVLINEFSVFMGIVVFLLIFISCIKQKIKYITQLECEVNILEGGELDYQLTIKGNDELTYLANSIDNMRKSIIDRQNEQQQARMANHKLVTAMSHDLRTPLTILIGLIEILDGKKYKDSNELDTYIAKTKNKAYQIKDLSDKIFEYFFAFDIKESELNKEPYSIEVIATMIEDYIFNFEQKGYRFDYKPCSDEAVVRIDTTVFSRVFVNIFSNILKYANEEEPISIELLVEDSLFKAIIKNSVIKKDYKEESTNIGLEVCKNILKQHSGSFESCEDEEYFSAVVILPVDSK